jgi:hypothetical protein
MSITEFLAGIPVNAVLRERIAALIEDKERLTKRVIELEQENARLVKQAGESKHQILAASSADQFVEHRSALFKRKPGGGYSETPYCFDCKRPMSSHMGMLPYVCKCGYAADFTGHQLRDVMRGLP